MTKQEMLDFINMNIARTASTEYSNIRTNYFLHVMIGDVLDFIENKWDNVEMKSTNAYTMDKEYTRLCKKQNQEIIEIVGWWKYKRLSLDQQPYETISYIYSLLKVAQ